MAYRDQLLRECMNKFYTYIHRKISNNVIFYVGKGCGNRAYSKRRSSHWKNVVSKHGLKVEIVLTELSEKEAHEAEMLLICMIGRLNNGTGTLINKTDGGEGSTGLVHSEATKEKIRASKVGTTHTAETRAIIGHKSKGRQTFLGRKHSDLTKSKMSEAIKQSGNPGAFKLGHSPSQETRLKIGEKMKGRVFSEETIRRMNEGRAKTREAKLRSAA